MDKEKILQDITAHLAGLGAVSIHVFGSFNTDSKNIGDIDLIVEFKDKKSLLDLVKIERELHEKTGIKADIQTAGSMSPYIEEKIASEKVKVY